MNTNDCLLEMKGICKAFPGVKALCDVDFSVGFGEVRILIGENGAGKSTLMKILAGAYPADKGRVRFNGEAIDLAGFTPRRALEKGIATIYQELNLNPYASVCENIFYGKEPCKCGVFLDLRKQMEETRRLLCVVGLDVDPRTRIMDLSIAQMQMVEIAKALSFDARLIIFDEPTSSLSETETKRLFEIIRELKAQGRGIIYISHRLEELFEIGDSCTVLRDGTLVATEMVKHLTAQKLVTMMVGRDVGFAAARQSRARDEVVLEVKGLKWGRKVQDVSFDLRRGECLAFSGLVGSGRTEIAKALIGEYRKESGEIMFNGRRIRNRSVKESVANGIVYLSEDRKKEGLFLKHSLQANLTIASLGKMKRNLLLDTGKMRKAALESIERLKIKAPGPGVRAEALSGGNQQKAIIAKWLLTGAQVFIFDEPTRGIDVGAKAEIYALMEELLAKGASIIMISSEMVEVLRMADRVLVMRDGCAQTILDNDGLTQEDVLKYAIGANVYHACTE